MTTFGDGTGQPAFPAVADNFHFLAYPANILVWISDCHGGCSFVSPSWTEFTGRDRSNELGRGWLDRVHPDDRHALQRTLDQAHSSQEPPRMMFRYLRKDGAFRWLMNQGMANVSPTNDFTGYVFLCFDVTPYQEGEAEVETAIQSIFPLLKQTRLIAVILDTQGRVLFFNEALCRLLQCTGTDLMNRRLFQQHLGAGGSRLLEQLYPGNSQSTLFPAEFHSEMRTQHDEVCHVSWHAIVWRDFAGHTKGTILIGDDVTALHREELQTSLYVKAFEATDHAIVVTDASGRIVSVNNAFTQLTGYSRDEALGQNPRLLQSGRHDQTFYKRLWATLMQTGHWHGDVWDRHKNGRIYPKYLSISAIRNPSDQLTHYVGIFYDNSERKTVEERLDYLAHYDALTGLPNRSLLLDRLEQALERAARTSARVALLYIDLDHFKMVNDAHGHSMGDALLKAVSQRMKATIRAADTVARLGGDEFVVLLPDVHEASDINTIANKLLETLTPPYEIENQCLTSTPSIGISLYPDDGADGDELIKRADAAMYQAKQSGRAMIQFFRHTTGPKASPA